jgi:hypothetical protein
MENPSRCVAMATGRSATHALFGYRSHIISLSQIISLRCRRRLLAFKVGIVVNFRLFFLIGVLNGFEWF